MIAQEAIIVRHARKRYGNAAIIDNLNMNVPRGIIYGLLGASGCGKTTLLSCIIGVRKLDSGKIWVLGGHPGSKDSGIPGLRVGYMPQDISLVQEFTVIGALYYFGRINGMKDESIDDRYIFLSELLNLPPKNRLIKHMSGGQQRRVSFAAALIHKPELLILDEPTVGLDPLLREKLWKFLVKITQEEGTTVVITTHYIEETKLANKIGLMRCGKLLAEASPKTLLQKFQTQTLEEVFLILSQHQKENQAGGIMEASSDLLELDESEIPIITTQNESFSNNHCLAQNEKVYYNYNVYDSESNCWKTLAFKKFQALMTKNLLQFLRHPGGILFAIVFPLVQMLVFFYSIGGDPKGLYLAIINYEAGDCNFGLNKGLILHSAVDERCDFVDLSCRFLHAFDDSIAEKVFYNDMEQATNDMKKGVVVGLIHFSKNFSKTLQLRRDEPTLLTTQDLIESQIDVWVDMGDRQTGLFVKRRVYDTYFQTYHEILFECGISPKYADIPLRLEQPIFGVLNPNIITFMAPTFILTVIFFLATSVSSSIIISDRHEGVWDRSIVQGVTTSEILLAHILTQLLVIIIQVTIILCISFIQFNLQCLGSMVAVILLVLLQGFCGMCYGFLISVMCTSHSLANYITTGTFYPVLLLCGCIWPIEGMPSILRWLSLILPTTIPGISLRSLMDKGYPINNPQVYNGFLVVSGWTTVLLTLCLLGLKYKAK